MGLREQRSRIWFHRSFRVDVSYGAIVQPPRSYGANQIVRKKVNILSFLLNVCEILVNSQSSHLYVKDIKIDYLEEFAIAFALA